MSDVVPADKFSRLPERYQRRAREIATRVSEIEALCRPASSQEVGAELKRLRRHFLPQPDTDVAAMAEGYRSSCRDLPAWAISEAANDYLDGRVDGHTGRYMPVCAEFAKRAREILIPFMSERSALRVEASKLIERAQDDHRRHLIDMERQDPAVRQRVSALVEKVTIGAAKKQSLPHGTLDEQKRRRLDAFRKPVPFKSKIDQTKIGRGE